MIFPINNVMEFKINRYIMKEYSYSPVDKMITITHVEVLNDPKEDLVINTLRNSLTECPWSMLGIFTSHYLYSSMTSYDKFIHLDKRLSTIDGEIDLYDYAYAFNQQDIKYFINQPNFNIEQSKIRFTKLSSYFIYMGNMSFNEVLKINFHNGDYL